VGQPAADGDGTLVRRETTRPKPSGLKRKGGPNPAGGTSRGRPFERLRTGNGSDSLVASTRSPTLDAGRCRHHFVGTERVPTLPVANGVVRGGGSKPSGRVHSSQHRAGGGIARGGGWRNPVLVAAPGALVFLGRQTSNPNLLVANGVVRGGSHLSTSQLDRRHERCWSATDLGFTCLLLLKYTWQ
jgi:hypothetical protein